MTIEPHLSRKIIKNESVQQIKKVKESRYFEDGTFGDISRHELSSNVDSIKSEEISNENIFGK
jgi:hypothetical protein